MKALQEEYGEVEVGACNFMRGEVLVDTYGNGTLQAVPRPEGRMQQI